MSVPVPSDAISQTANAPPTKSYLFRQEREKGWRELEELLEISRNKGLHALDAEQLQRLPILYRGALSSLSVARQISLDMANRLYLNNLALRSYLYVYHPATDLRNVTGEFCTEILAQTLLSLRWHMVAALIVIILAALSGFHITATNEIWFRIIVTTNVAEGRGPGSTASQLHTVLVGQDREIVEAFAQTVAKFLIENSMLCLFLFTLGVLAGIPTLFFLTHYGLTLGSLMALHSNRGLLLEWIGWWSVGGMFELAGLLMAGACGLALAEAVIFSGRLSRVDQLMVVGRVTAPGVMFAYVLFFVASIAASVVLPVVPSTTGRFAAAVVLGGSLFGTVIWLVWRRR